MLVQIVLVGGLLTACATRPTDPDDLAAYKQANDPLEPLNRHIFNFNRGVDFWLLRPTTKLYTFVVPEQGRTMVHNFLSNLSLPFSAANALLQGDPDRAGQAVERFATNTVAGVGGLFDPAGNEIPPVNEDFGQTLAVWGVDEGPYLMLPFFGPSNPRDAVGTAVEWFTDPVSLYLDHHGMTGLDYARTGTEVVDARSRNIETFDDIERTSLDFYAVVRSLYRQHRADQIRNGGVPDILGAPNKSDKN